MPKLNPSQAAQQAMEQYDTDGNGQLSPGELSAALGLSAARAQIDTDGDGNLTAVEIASRMESWLARKQAIHVLPCQVYYRGRELVGATVRFIPESFLGAAFRPAEGVTDDYGTANIVHAPEDRPDPDFPQGIRVGFYRVEISKRVDGREQLPSKFNSASKLGQEVAADAAGLGQGMLTFQLR